MSFVGKRKLGITGLTAAQHSSTPSNAHVTGTTPTRKPLSPVSSAYSSKANAAANIQVQSVTHNVVLPRTPSNKTPVVTPEKTISSVNENKTPKTMPIPMPTTPVTVSVAMQTAMTPAPPFVPHRAQEIEYSFEERRAGAVFPKSPPKPLLEV